MEAETVFQTIRRQATDMADRLQATRRDFHHYAEAGWFEFRTSSIIAARLAELGYEVLTGPEVCRPESRMGVPSEEVLEREYQRALDQGAIASYVENMRGGFTGVIGILRCGEGPTVAMRFDIDALGVQEDGSMEHRPSAQGFASVNDGVMHACGHDGHAAIGLGVAEILASLRNELRGTVKLIFQPAEEGVRGARAIVEHGHLDDVDYVIGNHMGPAAGDSQVSFSNDTTLATSKLDVTFHGKASHAAMIPERGNNALLAAATAVLNLQAVSRHSGGDTRINVGTLHAGTGRNVICDRAVLEMEVRGATTEVNDYVEAYARRIVEAAAAMHGCTCEIRPMGGAESLQSHPDMVTWGAAVCRDQLGLRVLTNQRAGASEDYSYMVNRVHSHGGKGLFFSTNTPCSGQFHGERFDFQEEALSTAVAVFCGLTWALMDGNTPD